MGLNEPVIKAKKTGLIKKEQNKKIDHKYFLPLKTFLFLIAYIHIRINV